VIERDKATLFVHVVRPGDFHVLVFGNGRVGARWCRCSPRCPHA
jgi:hypothetical protein